MSSKYKVIRYSKKTDSRSIFDVIQYYLLLAYITLVYIIGGNKDLTKIFYIPVILFSIIEIVHIVKTKKIYITKYIVSTFIFAFICLVSILWAIDKDIATIKTITIFLLTIMLLFTYNYSRRVNITLFDILKILIIAGTIFSLYIVTYYGIETLSGIFGNYTRIGSDIDNVNSIGLELALTAVIAVYLGSNKSKKYYICSIIPAVIALGTASKSAFIYMAIGIITIILSKYNNKISITKIIKKIIIILIVIASIVATVQMNIFPTLTRRINDYISSFKMGKTDESTSERNSLIQSGYESFTNNPIFGIGIANSNQIAIEAIGRSTYLHNNYLELLTTVGIIGTIVYYYTFISMLTNSIRNRNIQESSIIFTIALIDLIIDWGVVSYYDKVTYIIMLMGSIYYAMINKKEIKCRVTESKK